MNETVSFWTSVQGTIRMLAFAPFENNQGSMKIIYAIKQTAAICRKSIKRSFLEF